MTFAQTATPTCVRTRVCVCACVSQALWRGVLLTPFTVSFHMEINEEAPQTHGHIYSATKRECGVSADNLTQIKACQKFCFAIKPSIIQNSF